MGYSSWNGVSKVLRFRTGDSTAHCSRAVASRGHCSQVQDSKEQCSKAEDSQEYCSQEGWQGILFLGWE
jgi:hypothetical protein